MSENVVQHVPLDAIRMDLLNRDLVVEDNEDLSDLMTSLKDVGLLNPIRVIVVGDDGYELIQGHRRLCAYRRLLNETGDNIWSHIPALVSYDSNDLTALYRQMVDENLYHKRMSYAEMADAARKFAMDPSTKPDTVEDAIQVLFKSASIARREDILTFARLMDQIGSCLRFPKALPRNLGLALAREIVARPELVALIHDNLGTWQGRTLDNELDVLRIYARRDRYEMPMHKPADRSDQQDRNYLHIDDCTVDWQSDPSGISIGFQSDRQDLSEQDIEAGIRAFVVAVGPESRANRQGA